MKLYKTITEGLRGGVKVDYVNATDLDHAIMKSLTIHKEKRTIKNIIEVN